LRACPWSGGDCVPTCRPCTGWRTCCSTSCTIIRGASHGSSPLESASHVLHIVELFLILEALAIAAGIGTAVLIEGAAKFISLAFFFIPGQLGASEGVHALIFEAVGLPVVAGFTVPFVRRIRGVLVAALGLLGMALLTRR